uniref:Uncharacterized protein n=1 Tax=Tetranychus urticae TaxID=32264 RepID=T1K5L7_TETUR
MLLQLIRFWLISAIFQNCYTQRFYHYYPNRYRFVYPMIDYQKYRRPVNYHDYHQDQFHPVYLNDDQESFKNDYYPILKNYKGNRYKKPPHYLDENVNYGYDYEANQPNYDNHQEPIEPHVRFFGQPAPFAHSHDNFDKETTADEVISRRINPLPHSFNPALRSSITRLQHIEANQQKSGQPQ